MAVSKFFPMREPAWLISPLAVAGDNQSEAAGHRKRSRQGGLPVVVWWAGSSQPTECTTRSLESRPKVINPSITLAALLGFLPAPARTWVVAPDALEWMLVGLAED